jgi:hypothetical protein
MSVTSPAAVTRTGPATVVAYVQGFYRSYVAARKLGQRAAAAVVRSHVAAWYFPILEAPYTAGADPVECGLRGPVAGWRFKQAGVLGGQAVIVIGSQPPGAPQELWIVATTVPGTGKITGITCSTGEGVTSTGARDAATSWYSPYITARRQRPRPRRSPPGLVTTRRHPRSRPSPQHHPVVATIPAITGTCCDDGWNPPTDQWGQTT